MGLIAQSRTGLHRGMHFFGVVAVQEALLEQQQGDHPNRDGRIGNVEDGRKELKAFPAHQWYPLGPGGLNDGEVQHVHHVAVQKAGITMTGESRSHGIVVAGRKDQPIEHRVDQVAQGTGVDQGGTYNKATGIALLHDAAHVPGTKDHSGQAEQGQDHLPPVATKLPTPGHAFILDKIQLEPGQSCHVHHVPKWKGGLDPELQRLIGYNHRYNKEYGRTQFHAVEI